MDLAHRQTNLASARDTAVRNLRDLTIAIAIAATAGVGLTAWVSAATIPGSTGSSGSSGTAANQPISSADQSFAQAPPSNATFGAGVAVSGGSR
ncbi:MAG TPA: hypothetical protein VGU71_13740 [Candidatus Dormibacteraeota bacterium]|nr:hypothetical protein [Candidatus Dormibacteraeota bacterium]